MIIPFLDLKAQYKKIQIEIKQRLEKVLDSTQFVLGAEVEEFEKKFASFCEAEYCVACNSGTSALHLALLASGIKPDDEVILPAHTFIATAEAVSYCQAKPVFAEIDPRTYTLDPAQIKAKITGKTKAIIPVHLYGQPADLDPIKKTCQKERMILIEDAAQAHGARYKKKRVGSFGNISCFSFYPGKNLGAYGEGGAVVTNDESLAHEIRILRDHGQPRKYHHEAIGFNYRMDGFQGAVLNVKLKYLDEWNSLRRQKAKLYNELLDKVDIITPSEPGYAESVYHLYVVLSDNREELKNYLEDNGVGTGLHYPIPLHLQKAYQFLRYKKGDFPVTEKVSNSLLSLPIYPELENSKIEYICELIKKFHPVDI